MKEKVLVKGKEYSISSKYGMEDEKGNSIIPREYDAIIRLDNNLFAAIKSTLVSYTNESDGLHANNILKKEELKSLWKNNDLKSFSGTKIDFYSVNGKFKYDKEVVACYWSKDNYTLIIFDEKGLWDIAYLDYANQKIIQDDSYTDLNEIDEIYDGRLIVYRKGAFEILSLKDGMHIGPLNCSNIEVNENGIIFIEEDDKRGAMTYSGEVIVTGMREITFRDRYIKVTTSDSQEAICSYSGDYIVLPTENIIPVELQSGGLFFICLETDKSRLCYSIISENSELLFSSDSYISILENGMIVYSEDKKFGLLQYENGKIKEILPAKFKNIKLMTSKLNILFIAAKRRFWYDIYDMTGKKLEDANIPVELWDIN